MKKIRPKGKPSSEHQRRESRSRAKEIISEIDEITVELDRLCHQLYFLNVVPHETEEDDKIEKQQITDRIEELTKELKRLEQKTKEIEEGLGFKQKDYKKS